MKLYAIVESKGQMDKFMRKLKELMQLCFPNVNDHDALVKYVIDGCSTSTFLIRNPRWWDKLKPLFTTVKPDDFDKSFKETQRVMEEFVADEEKLAELLSDVYNEGIGDLLSRAMSLLKTIVLTTVKAVGVGVGIGAGLVSQYFGGGRGGYSSHGGYGGSGRGGRNQNNQQNNNQQPNNQQNNNQQPEERKFTDQEIVIAVNIRSLHTFLSLLSGQTP